MINLKTVFALVIGAAFLFGCGKYEEGPGISLRTKKMRLTGEWEIDEYVVDNENFTSDFNFYEIEFTNDNEFTERGQLEGFETFTFEGDWDFSGDKEELELEYDDGDRADLKIIRLTNSELWVELTEDADFDDNDELIELKLNKK